MPTLLKLALALALPLAASIAAYTQQESGPVIHATTQLVVVDVTVLDAAGHPVHGLKREDFTLAEDKQPQQVRHFEEHRLDAPPVAGPELPPMPAGMFTNYTPTPPTGALNVLLLDALNTPMTDQAYVRDQLKEYVKKARPGTQIAIFGLTTKLVMLQGFDSNIDVLKNAVEHKAKLQSSDLLDDPVGTNTTGPSASEFASDMLSTLGPTGAATLSALQQFDAQQEAMQLQFRIQYTLDAFNALAHYLAAFPGRKNLIWFSGSFPLDILPDPSLENSFAVMEDNNPEYRETTNLLSRAQVAVYPLDARGLMTDPTFSASSRGGANLRNPGSGSMKFNQQQAGEHLTMTQLAEDTGGQAFYNTNDLASAVQQAVAHGANYYTLAYSPQQAHDHADYREIRVKLSDALMKSGYTLSYRHGYYTDNPTSAATTTAAMASTAHGDAYARAAMAHGAPLPQDLLFKARVLPIAAPATAQVVAGNLPNTDKDAQSDFPPPYRRFAVDLAAIPRDYTLTLNPATKRYEGAIAISILLYNDEGQLLNAVGQSLRLNLTEESYQRFQKRLEAHFEISVPVKGGAADFLRIGIHDVPTNRFGAVEIPVSSVAGLTPLPTAPEKK